MVFGAHKIDSHIQRRNRHSILMYPDEIFIHKDWNLKNHRFDADLALLVMTQDISVTSFITPICLWTDTNNTSFYEGFVAGFGLETNYRTSYEPMQSQSNVEIHTQENCFLDVPAFARISSNRTFCAGSIKGSGRCNGKFSIKFKIYMFTYNSCFPGDSGTGLFIHHNETYYLKGTASATLFRTQANQCDFSNLALYTDVFKFVEWIFFPRGQSEIDAWNQEQERRRNQMIYNNN